MMIVPLTVGLVPAVKAVLVLGAPYIGVRTDSDYWLYATLFSGTCPVMVDGDEVAGVVIAFRSQDDPDQVYVQDVMVHPDHRGRGVAGELVRHVAETAAVRWGCRRLYLTSEPDNTAADQVWRGMGFVNVPGDLVENGVQVVRDFKGPGKHRAVYELALSRP
jgi:ribosomal protein S18 acetylase RimI-like enzyme